MSEDKSVVFKYKVTFGGGRGEGEWHSETIVEGDCISDAVRELDRIYEGCCSGWGNMTVFSISQAD